MPAWRFWTPLLIQMALLVSVPAQSAYTYATGETVVLQTAPVDPYDFLRGYYQTLSYDVSDPSILRVLPGGAEVFATESPGSFYVVLQQPETSPGPRPTPWQPVSVSPERPDNLGPNQVALRGETTQWGQIRYGLESYYMPEDRREELNRTIGEVQQQDIEAFVAEVKVDRRGNAVPVSLWVREQNYRF
ncbi:MAG: GDYXXLXY domain-containing protein [Cyanobacteria bacterium Co-bin8]|nr:GDYXXLXY domain-containing protein [Cyanobacteria bacterium Co-bin8]